MTERGYRNEAATEIAERCWAAPFSPASFLPGIPADQNRKCSANFSVPADIHSGAELTLLALLIVSYLYQPKTRPEPVKKSKYSEFADMEKFHTVVSTLQRQALMMSAWHEFC